MPHGKGAKARRKAAELAAAEAAPSSPRQKAASPKAAPISPRQKAASPKAAPSSPRDKATSPKAAGTSGKRRASEPEAKARPSKRRKKQAPAEEEDLQPGEQTRRNLQRELQQLVIRMRAEGKSEAAIQREKVKLKKELAPREKAPGPHPMRAKKEESAPEPVEKQEKRELQQRREELGSKHEVVVVPVAWRGKTDSKEKVDVICDKIKQALMTRGLDCWVDMRRHYTPGQKMAYWEHLGVEYRIEVGPNEAEQGKCKIVRSATPGAYLEHKRATVGLTAGAILRQLKLFELQPKSEQAQKAFESLGDAADKAADEALSWESPKKSPKRKPDELLDDDFFALG